MPDGRIRRRIAELADLLADRACRGEVGVHSEEIFEHIRGFLRFSLPDQRFGEMQLRVGKMCRIQTNCFTKAPFGLVEPALIKEGHPELRMREGVAGLA